MNETLRNCISVTGRARTLCLQCMCCILVRLGLGLEISCLLANRRVGNCYFFGCYYRTSFIRGDKSPIEIILVLIKRSKNVFISIIGSVVIFIFYIILNPGSLLSMFFHIFLHSILFFVLYLREKKKNKTKKKTNKQTNKQS